LGAKLIDRLFVNTGTVAHQSGRPGAIWVVG